MTDKRIKQYKLRNKRKKKSKGLDSLGRMILGICLVLVVLLFGASWFGFFGSGDRVATDEKPGRQITRADWQPVGGDESEKGNFVNQVTTWVNENFTSETGLQVNELADGAAPTGGAGARVEMPPPVKVTVANGCGVNRFAARFKNELREVGFDVWGVTDADCSNYSATLIIDRIGNIDRAQEVCSYFQARWGVGRILLQERAGCETDVLVVLGEDLARAVAAESPQP